MIKCAKKTRDLNGNKHFVQVLSKVSGRLGDRVRDIREWREELRTEVNNAMMLYQVVSVVETVASLQ